MSDLTQDLTVQEVAVLLATRESESAQTAEELASTSDHQGVRLALEHLVQMGILQPIESFDNRIVYGYVDNELSQRIYEEIHRL